MSRIGHYTIKRTLGKGGFGEVFLAEKGGSEYALKHLVQVADYIKERFFKEATRINKLREEHELEYLVHIHDILIDENSYVMEYLPEGSRGYWLRTHDDNYIPQLAHAVKELHNAHIVHRDIKPDNIRTRGAMPVLIDFGIASWQDSTTGIDMGIGTPIYSPPESILHAGGAHAVAQRAAAQILSIKGADKHEQIRNAKKLHDVYSLGLSIGYICTGELPFSEADFFDYLRTGKTGQYGKWLKMIPESYRGFVRDATAFFPLDRPFIDALVPAYFKQRPLKVTSLPEPKKTDPQHDVAYCFPCGKQVDISSGRCSLCGAPRSFLALCLLPSEQSVQIRNDSGPKVATVDKDGGKRRETLLLLPSQGPDFAFTIGKDALMDIAFDDDQWMSRCHGRFIKKGEGIFFFDGINGKMPKNPSRYDGYMIGEKGIQLLHDGHLVIGSTLCAIQYCCGEPADFPGAMRIA